VPLGLVMIDVDHFKAFNDTYGHPAGDDCLRRVAQAIQAAVHRPYDLVARYGGEEMVALLPATPEDGCTIVAEHILAAVSALGIVHEKSSAADHVTVSIGVATVLPDGVCDEAGLVAAADRALYAAKRGGRNRVACAWAIAVS
jgi:diguanylate cyclase (GGDEF)-like protein